MESSCPFCDNNQIAWRTVMGTKHFLVILDKFPVNKGHMLIISKRHVIDVFSMNDNEWKDLETVITRIKMILDRTYKPDGYNIGMNCGEAAGQTVPHLHVHLIPRYKGDVENPIGGIRNFMPGKMSKANDEI